MTKHGKILPTDVIAGWPEVFGEVNLTVLPLKYLSVVKVRFNDGKFWEINVTPKDVKNGWDAFEQTLSDFFKSYEKSISGVDFQLDTDKIRKDVEQSTQKFLKKRKLA